MKKLCKVTLILALLIGANASIWAQGGNTSSATGTARATVVTPIHLTWNQPLAFGTIVPSGGLGTAYMDLTGVNVPSSTKINKAPTCTGCTPVNGQNLAHSFVDPGPAVFSVTGQLGFTFAISLPPVTQAIPVHIINTDVVAPDMTVDAFQATVGTPGVIGSVGTLIHGTGKEFFAVGATLHVPANAAPGYYEGQFLCTVAYN